MPLSTRIHAFIRQNVLGLVAIFIALGGTAYATHPGGENTISTEDLQNLAVTQQKLAGQAVSSGKIVDDAVRTPKIRDLAVTPEKLQSLAVKTSKIGGKAVSTSKLGDGAVTSAKVADDSLTASDLDGVELLGASTARLNDTPGGGAAGQALLTIGRVQLSAFCDNTGELLRTGISPRVDEAGPVLVTDGEGSAADFVLTLQPFDVQFVVIVSSDAGLAGQEKSFAILDTGGTSASGVAAASVNPATGDCVLTAHAVG